jgi:hypothetical protein
VRFERGGLSYLSRLRGRSDRIARCDPGGGSSIHTGSVTRGDTPTIADAPHRRSSSRTAASGRLRPPPQAGEGGQSRRGCPYLAQDALRQHLDAAERGDAAALEHHDLGCELAQLHGCNADLLKPNNLPLALPFLYARIVCIRTVSRKPPCCLVTMATSALNPVD